MCSTSHLHRCSAPFNNACKSRSCLETHCCCCGAPLKPKYGICILTFLGFGKSLNASKGIQSQLYRSPTLMLAHVRRPVTGLLWPVSTSTRIHVAVRGGGTRSSNSGWKRTRALVRHQQIGKKVSRACSNHSPAEFLFTLSRPYRVHIAGHNVASFSYAIRTLQNNSLALKIPQNYFQLIYHYYKLNKM